MTRSATHKKIKSAKFNNRKKQITVTYDSGKAVTVHYGQLGIRQGLSKVWIDKETRRQSIGLRFRDGSMDFMPYDQPLSLSKDPEFMLRNHMELLTAQIELTRKKQRISKRFLAEALGTSDNQIQRLLNPDILNKNLEQIYQIASLLGLQPEITLKAA